MNKEELWIPLCGYEGNYEISNFGKVRSLEREGSKGGIMAYGINNQGYPIVTLSKRGKRKTFRVHRLVAENFMTNDEPKTKNQVNHINEDKLDNRVENLEWVTPKYNANYGNRNRKLANIHSKAVMGINLKTGERVIFSSTHATEQFGFNFQNVAQVARGERNSHKGFRWEYVEMDLKREITPVVALLTGGEAEEVSK